MEYKPAFVHAFFRQKKESTDYYTNENNTFYVSTNTLLLIYIFFQGQIWQSKLLVIFFVNF